jgi:single-strand DNA-binding protein
MASINKVILVGNCGRDPEMRYLPDGKAVCNVSLATTSRRKNPQTGETTEDTQWHRLTFYERLAEIAGEYVKKGAPIYVEGKIKYGKFTNKDGAEQNTVDIIVTELQLLGSREGGQAGGQQSGQSAPRQQAQQGTPRQQAPRQDQGQQAYGAHRGGQAPRQSAPPQQAAQHAGGGAASGGGFSDMDDDDIPFITSSPMFDMVSSKARRMSRYDY